MRKTCGSSTSDGGGERREVDDQGFEFRPPPSRREPQAFEPPPWEKEAFQELERRRAPEEAAGEDGEEGPIGSEVPQDESESEAADEASVDKDSEARRTAAVDEAARPSGSEGAGVPHSVVLEMMAGLAAEEPRATEAYSNVALATGLFLGALGGVLVVWSIAALVGSRTTGWIGQVTGAGLGLFGVFFFGMGVWLLYRTLKQRGVL
jgi:hypothetical protein